MKIYQIKTGLIAVLVLVATACGTINKKNKGKGINLFTVQQDRDLGATVAQEIDGNPQQYPFLYNSS